MVPKKQPMRKCLGCGEMFPQKELVRVVKTKLKDADGNEAGFEISLDLTGKKAGRGAYICPDPECLKKAQKAKSLERSLEVPIPDEVYRRLAGEMEGGIVG